MLIPVTNAHAISAESFWIVLCEGKVLVQQQSSQLPKMMWRELVELHEYTENVLQLVDFQNQPTTYYVVDVGAQKVDIAGHEFVSLRQAMMVNNADAFGVIGRAWQLAHFYQTHRFCGKCGSSMTRIDWEVAVQCFRCDHRCYPRVSPCVIVAIHRENQILLAQGTRHRSGGMFSTIAGFVESGESLEQAVHREIKEEVGVNVSHPEYFGSQPWPFPHALMVGYIAHWKSGDIAIDEKEISEAHWFDVHALPTIPPKFSIAGQLIQAVVDRYI